MPWVENLTNLVVKKQVANTRGHGRHKYFSQILLLTSQLS